MAQDHGDAQRGRDCAASPSSSRCRAEPFPKEFVQNAEDAGATEVDGLTVVDSQPNLLQETVRTFANSVHFISVAKWKQCVSRRGTLVLFEPKLIGVFFVETRSVVADQTVLSFFKNIVDHKVSLITKAFDIESEAGFVDPLVLCCRRDAAPRGSRLPLAVRLAFGGVPVAP